MEQVSFSRITIVQMKASTFLQGLMLPKAFRTNIPDVYVLSYTWIVPCFEIQSDSNLNIYSLRWNAT